MRLELYRYSSQKDSTLGILYLVDDETNKKDFLCFSLEDEKRETKVYEKLAYLKAIIKLNTERKGVISLNTRKGFLIYTTMKEVSYTLLMFLILSSFLFIVVTLLSIHTVVYLLGMLYRRMLAKSRF